LSYLVAALFINRFRAEILLLMILLIAIAITLYFLQRVRQTKLQKSTSMTAALTY